MNKQPKPLQLAKYLESFFISEEIDASMARKIAAELRRLHAENEDYGATIDYLTRENAEQIGEIVALKEQRDELLEALATCRANFRRYEEQTLKMAQAEDEERASLRTQRDELLEALHRIADTSATQSGTGAPWVHWVDQARAAIAKAEGEKT